MSVVLRYKFSYKGIDGFLDSLEEMASKHLRDCRCLSFDNFVAYLGSEIGFIVRLHPVDLGPVHDNSAFVTEYLVESIIDQPTLDRTFARAAEELHPDCMFVGHVVS